MITLRVATYEGQPIARQLETAFDEMGGTIGRADTNQLVLPDPKRHISRVHARIVFRGGGYVLLDQGSNAVLVNGTRVGNGNAAVLKDGDEIVIGDYRLVAAIRPAAATNQPFSNTIGLNHHICFLFFWMFHNKDCSRKKLFCKTYFLTCFSKVRKEKSFSLMP